ncbi:MAG: DHH family phosphoesterase [Candidatus Aquicultorales bacterium]
MVDLGTAVSKINEVEKVAVATHVDPDGDAVGALLGMALILRKMGKDVAVLWHEGQPFPPQYVFLAGKNLLSEGPKDTEAFVVLDCGSPGRLGSLLDTVKSAQVLINIDHHPDNTGFNEYKAINVVRSDASSTCEIVYDFAKTAGVGIEADAALCLYVGIVTDTGRFQYSNTSAATHEIVADLIRIGKINVTEVFHKVFEQLSYGSLKLMSAVVNSAVLLKESKLIYSVVTRGLIESTGGKLEELETLIDYLRMVRDADVAALVKEVPGGDLRVSLRSKGGVDVSAIARVFGGGGHRNAAAYPSSRSIEETVEALRQEVDKERGVAVGERNPGSR